MHRSEGELVVSGSIAYCPQNPWWVDFKNLTCNDIEDAVRIMSATVRDNILFSHAYDPEFYQEVIEG